MYSIDCWGSHPDHDNDDCWYGFDFETAEEAYAAFKLSPQELARRHWPDHRVDMSDVAYLELSRDTGEIRDGAKVVEHLALRPNPEVKHRRVQDDDWAREIAHQAGMAFGCQGYNDVRGW